MSFGRALALVGALVLAPSAVLADIQLVGDTNSSYFAATNNTIWQGLTFLPNAFDVTTIGGTAELTGSDNLGRFELECDGCPDVYLGRDQFRLRFNFSLPEMLLTQPQFTADIFGVVTQYVGFVVLAFDKSYQDFNYQTAEGSGSFRLSLAPDPYLGPGAITVWSGSGVDLNARVENAVFTPGAVQVPEPETVVLMLTMLSGVAFWRRKDLRNSFQ
jgi:hypothetical protein